MDIFKPSASATLRHSLLINSVYRNNQSYSDHESSSFTNYYHQLACHKYSGILYNTDQSVMHISTLHRQILAYNLILLTVQQYFFFFLTKRSQIKCFVILVFFGGPQSVFNQQYDENSWVIIHVYITCIYSGLKTFRIKGYKKYMCTFPTHVSQGSRLLGNSRFNFLNTIMSLALGVVAKWSKVLGHLILISLGHMSAQVRILAISCHLFICNMKYDENYWDINMYLHVYITCIYSVLKTFRIIW